MSLDEAEASEEKVGEPVVDDESTSRTTRPAGDTFLEEEEEDDDDVTALIDGDIATDEEP